MLQVWLRIQLSKGPRKTTFFTDEKPEIRKKSLIFLSMIYCVSLVQVCAQNSVERILFPVSRSTLIKNGHHFSTLSTVSTKPAGSGQTPPVNYCGSYKTQKKVCQGLKCSCIGKIHGTTLFDTDSPHEFVRELKIVKLSTVLHIELETFTLFVPNFQVLCIFGAHISLLLISLYFIFCSRFGQSIHSLFGRKLVHIAQVFISKVHMHF